MTQHNRKTVIAACLGMGMAVVSGIASGAAAVQTWTYWTDADFTAATFSSGTGSSFQDASRLWWGKAGADDNSFTDTNLDAAHSRSALTIGSGSDDATRYDGGPKTGSVNTVFGGNYLGQVQPGVTFTHFNNTISDGRKTLLKGEVDDVLKLTPSVPVPGPEQTLPKIHFKFNFSETDNDGPCAGGTPTPCGDIFGFDGTQTLNQSFTYDGKEYFASIFVSGPGGANTPIQPLLQDQCTAIGLAAGCLGFLTKEDAATTVQFGFAITTAPIRVPEPGSLALFGLAFAGLGFGRRRKSS